MSTKIQEFVFDGTTVRFAPTGEQQYPYRAIINNRAAKVGWLKYIYDPNKHAARYFYSKCVLGVDDSQILERAVKKEKQPEGHTLAAFQQWLRAHEWEAVGEVGHYNTPIARYIEETRETWKHIGGFLIQGVYHNRPRWMYRLQEYLASQELRNEVMGYQMIICLSRENWDTKQYDI